MSRSTGFRAAAAPVAVPDRDITPLDPPEWELDQRPRGELVRDDDFWEDGHACAGLDQASDRLVGRQLHDHVEQSRIDAGLAQRPLEHLARAGPLLVQHPVRPAQIIDLDDFH
jgi:hypothetical protein